ncbi:MAG: AtpZ/AtpI family protein [Dehalococcoidia bacterium]|jgi:F0F1-type ATP synthase assembly protein I|nr:AtpZ/AtpI family protein [Dehalococcoidia bacterium]
MGRLPPAVRLLGIGWYFALCIVLGIVGGVLLDRQVGKDHIFTLIGLFLGLILAFFGGYIMLLEELGLRQRRQGDDE